MKKVLFLGRFSPPVHGAIRMNEFYFKALKNDPEFAMEKIRLNRYESLEEIGRISFKKLMGYCAIYKDLILKLVRFRPDVVYLEMAPKGFAFLKDSVCVLIAKIFRKQIAIQFQAKGVKQSTKTLLARCYYKFVFRNTRIFLLSDILFQDIANVALESQVSAVPNGIPDEITDEVFEIALKKRSQNEKPHFLFLSNMIESKGPLDVLHVCQMLDKNGIDFTCNLVGEFQDPAFRARFNEHLQGLNIEGKCQYLGPKYGEDKKAILEMTDVMIFPTRYDEECFPLVILEAFMYGIPVLSYGNGAIPQIISRDFLGYVSNDFKWEEIADELIKMLKGTSDSWAIRKTFKSRHTIELSTECLKQAIRH